MKRPLKAVEALWRRPGTRGRPPGHAVDVRFAAEHTHLRHAVRQFTVRRTKTDLNRMVDQTPDRYRSAATGRTCRYPAHRAVGYELHETAEDRNRAAEIREIARGLRGIARLRSTPIVLPAALRTAGWSETRYVEQRVAAAAALARHDVAAALRSSTARLLEHLRGTDAALRTTPTLAGLALTPAKSGVIKRTRDAAGRPPRVDASVRGPAWLSDAAAHAEAARDDATRYEQIGAIAQGLSDARERAKADLLAHLLDEHALVLAFDSHVITLYDLAARVRAHPAFRTREALVVTGGAAGPRRRLYEAFGPESRARGLVALCSDAVSESVNLQAASAVVMLDTPSVIRVAEQRVGRVDRMNTAHDVVAAYWPTDAPEFALRSSERLVERHRSVDVYLGSNLPLPASMAEAPDPADDRTVGYQAYVAELAAAESRRAARADLQDAFAPVRALIDAPTALVPPRTYAALRTSRARVLASVGVVRSAAAFGFFAVAGTEYGAPRWVYLDGPGAAPQTDLADVAAALRARLAPDPPDAPLDEAATALLARMLAQLERHEEALLPRAKQRALGELRWVCARYRRPVVGDDARGPADERRAVLDELLRLVV